MSLDSQSALIGLAAAIVAVWLLPQLWPRVRDLMATRDMGYGAFLVGAAVALAIATYLRLLPLTTRPLPFAADIERIYRLSAFTTWEHFTDPQDYHHPGLWFALLHIPFELSGRSFLVPAGLGRLCAVLTVPMVGVLVARYSGRLAAFLAMLSVALLPFLTAEARELSDVTLFVLLGVSSLAAYGRARAQPTLARLAALWLVLALAANASYAAPVLVGALFVDAALKRTARGALITTVLLAALTGAPRIWHVAKLLPGEVAMRSALGELTVSHWANVSVSTFAIDAARDYFTSAFPYVLPFVLAALWFGRKIFVRQSPEIVLTTLAYAAFLCAQPFLRIRPYYAALLPVLLLVLVASAATVRQPDEEMLAAARRRSVAVIASAVCVLAFAYAIAHQLPDVFQADEIAARDVIQKAIDDKATRLASSNWTETTWYFFEDPIGTMGGCIRRNDVGRCHPPFEYDEDLASGRRYYRLWDGPLPGKPEETIAKFRRVQMDGIAHLLLDPRSPTDAGMFAYAQDHCTSLAHIGMWQMWRCPQIDAAGAGDGVPTR